MKSLLIKDNKLEFNQEKWFRSITNANISIKNKIYSLKVTDNKITLIYENNKLINTKPLII